MHCVTLILILFLIDANVTKSFKAFNELADEEKEHLSLNREGAPKSTKEARDDYELLALIIMDDETLTRRSFRETNVLKSKEESAEDDLEPRSRGKSKKRRVDKLKDLESLGNRDDDDGEDATETLREHDPLSVKKSITPTALRSACMKESSKGIEKCIRACNRSHEDVCDRLACSTRSKKALRKECEFNCNKIFNPRLCY